VGSVTIAAEVSSNTVKAIPAHPILGLDAQLGRLDMETFSIARWGAILSVPSLGR